jgi:hypothetical protein
MAATNPALCSEVLAILATVRSLQHGSYNEEHYAGNLAGSGSSTSADKVPSHRHSYAATNIYNRTPLARSAALKMAESTLGEERECD